MFTQIQRTFVQANPLTWSDCFKCSFTFIARHGEAKAACDALAKKKHRKLPDCSKPTNGFLDHGLYAAQLAWWLQWFPADRFLVLSSNELRTNEGALNVRPCL